MIVGNLYGARLEVGPVSVEHLRGPATLQTIRAEIAWRREQAVDCTTIKITRDQLTELQADAANSAAAIVCSYPDMLENLRRLADWIDGEGAAEFQRTRGRERCSEWLARAVREMIAGERPLP